MYHASPERSGSLNQQKKQPDGSIAERFFCVRRVRILIVDPDVATCQVIAAALARPGFEIVALHDPSLVESIVCSEPGAAKSFDLVIMDRNLPQVEIKQFNAWMTGHHAEARLIFFASSSQLENLKTLFGDRLVAVLSKPLQLLKLRALTAQCLERMGLLRMTEEAMRAAIGSVIRARRKALQLTLGEVGEMTELSMGYVSQIELAKCSSSIEALYRICIALGIKMSELFQVIQADE